MDLKNQLGLICIDKRGLKNRLIHYSINVNHIVYIDWSNENYAKIQLICGELIYARRGGLCDNLEDIIMEE